MMTRIPQAWMDELNDRFALVTDPEGRASVLDAMAYAAHRRGEVSDENLVDMLELSEAARAWGLVEVDEAYHIGLFSYEISNGWDGDEPGRVVVGRTPGWGC
ncbi:MULTISPECIES: hypothetical protein [Pseudomonas]|jgi:hypothetical protein|uniref:hypothetical protein n=1 Tax=Pseudomonas TaxID=286 RepID=UPI000C88EC98|nr:MULTISPECIES: hypothetical protein [Pseudomonas]MCE0961712.1 hypothetical protein [Pseudomonas putida]PNA92289.1 hypothetical protein C1X74_23240 [Pseudomonas sp. GW460-5]PNB56029.1 hypothetical protein C1X73_20230 [Pseudomonas sp. FW305-130]